MIFPSDCNPILKNCHWTPGHLDERYQTCSYRGAWVRKVLKFNFKSTSWKCELTKILTPDSKRKIFELISLYKSETFDRYLEGRNQTCSYEEKWVWITTHIIYNDISFAILRLSVFWSNVQSELCRKQIHYHKS